MKIQIILLCTLTTIMVLASCTNDKLEDNPIACSINNPATYDVEIVTIINNNCAYSGCHVTGGGAPGDYGSYSGLTTAINSGNFKSRVITQREDPNLGMPPNYATGPMDLSPSELELIQCWIDAGYPEN